MSLRVSRPAGVAGRAVSVAPAPHPAAAPSNANPIAIDRRRLPKPRVRPDTRKPPLVIPHATFRAMVSPVTRSHTMNVRRTLGRGRASHAISRTVGASPGRSQIRQVKLVGDTADTLAAVRHLDRPRCARPTWLPIACRESCFGPRRLLVLDRCAAHRMPCHTCANATCASAGVS